MKEKFGEGAAANHLAEIKWHGFTGDWAFPAWESRGANVISICWIVLIGWLGLGACWLSGTGAVVWMFRVNLLGNGIRDQRPYATHELPFRMKKGIWFDRLDFEDGVYFTNRLWRRRMVSVMTAGLANDQDGPGKGQGSRQ